jgi:hypothetical protein
MKRAMHHQALLHALFMVSLTCVVHGGCSSPDGVPVQEPWDAREAQVEQGVEGERDEGLDARDAAENLLPAEVAATHAWSIEAMCPELWGLPDGITGHDVFVYANDGDEALHVTLDEVRGYDYPTAGALVSFDIKTGQERSCLKFPSPYVVPMSVTRYDPARRVAYFSFHNDPFHVTPDEEQIGDVGFGRGVLGVHVDTGDIILEQTEREFGNDMPGPLVLAFNSSQVVFTPDRERLVSLDAITGEVRWQLDGEVPARPGEVWNTGELFTPTSGHLFSIYNSRDLFEIDERGRATLRYHVDAPGTLRGPLFMEDSIVMEEHSPQGHTVKVWSGWDGDIVHQEPRCGWVFSMSPRRIGCVERDPDSGQLRVVNVNLDGTQRVERTVKVPEGLERIIWTELVALSPRHVLVTVSGSRMNSQDERSTSLRDFYIVDMAQPDVPPAHVESIKPDINWPSFGYMTPLFTRGGVVVVEAWGMLYGIQTNIPWTDRGPAPRGPNLGGNQNSGHAAWP